MKRRLIYIVCGLLASNSMAAAVEHNPIHPNLENPSSGDKLVFLKGEALNLIFQNTVVTGFVDGQNFQFHHCARGITWGQIGDGDWRYMTRLIKTEKDVCTFVKSGPKRCYRYTARNNNSYMLFNETNEVVGTQFIWDAPATRCT